MPATIPTIQQTDVAHQGRSERSSESGRLYRILVMSSKGSRGTRSSLPEPGVGGEADLWSR
jgi:hypothetical protein